jgi:hypothetical protein
MSVYGDDQIASFDYLARERCLKNSVDAPTLLLLGGA